MPKIRYTDFYDQIIREGSAEYYFNDTKFDDLGRPVEVMQLRSAMAQWAKANGIKLATRYSKATQTLTAHLLK